MSSEEVDFVFVCPECDETLEVNAPMRETLIEKGCVICGASVSTDAFSSPSSTER